MLAYSGLVLLLYSCKLVVALLAETPLPATYFGWFAVESGTKCLVRRTVNMNTVRANYARRRQFGHRQSHVLFY